MQNLWECRDFLFDELSKTQDWEQKKFTPKFTPFCREFM